MRGEGTMPLCAVDECDKQATHMVPVTPEADRNLTITVPLCRWHTSNLDPEMPEAADYLCPNCNGPVLEEAGTIEGESATFYCCPGCNEGWHEDMMWEALRDRLRAEYEATS